MFDFAAAMQSPLHHHTITSCVDRYSRHVVPGVAQGWHDSIFIQCLHDIEKGDDLSYGMPCIKLRIYIEQMACDTSLSE